MLLVDAYFCLSRTLILLLYLFSLKWYRLQIDGKKLPIMVAENGDFANMYTKEKIFPYEKKVITKYRNAGKTDKVFYMYILKYDYEEELNIPPYKRKVRIKCSLREALKQSLPLPEELIAEKFNLHPFAKSPFSATMIGSFFPSICKRYHFFCMNAHFSIS